MYMEIKAHWTFALDMNIKAAAVGGLYIMNFISKGMGFCAGYHGSNEAAYKQYSFHDWSVVLDWTAKSEVLLHL